jgi:hypothetical protein
MVQNLNPSGARKPTIQTNTAAHPAFVPLGLKHLEEFNDYSPPSSTQVKNE